MDLTQNYFELFGLPAELAVDQAQLRQQYRMLQTQFHPDKYASKSSSEQRLAEQFSGLINSAFQTLSSSLLTAEYLITLTGQVIDNENLTIADGAFLFKQMEWRESLADMDLADVDKAESLLEDLTAVVAAERQAFREAFVNHFEKNDLAACMQIIAKWHFVEKMQDEIEQLDDNLFEENN